MHTPIPAAVALPRAEAVPNEMTCNIMMWTAVAINVVGLVLNIACSARAIWSWNRANQALDIAIKARAQVIRDTLDRIDQLPMQ